MRGAAGPGMAGHGMAGPGRAWHGHHLYTVDPQEGQ